MKVQGKSENIMEKQKLIEVKNLSTYFYLDEGIAKAVDGVSFEIYPNETLGVVGESGCGKSITALSILRLVPPPGKIFAGEIFLEGNNLLNYSQEKMNNIRGNDITMIFQEPMTSLNPVLTIGQQVSEAVMYHHDVGEKKARVLSIEMLEKVGISMPERRFNDYPHLFSGGMRQRVMIAMSLVCNPKLLIADEPTTALDVTIQAQILDLIEMLKKNFNMSIMMITHDLGVIAEVADRVAVMYAGRIIEYADVNSIFDNPTHPYTLGLIRSLPSLEKEVKRLQVIPGTVPSPLEFPKGCKFNPRCPLVDKKCFATEPDIEEVKTGHMVRCWHYKKIGQIKQENDQK